jgi:hypothetical protein
MEIINVTPINILGGSFFGNLVTALSVSSSLEDGHGSADLMYLVDVLVSSLSRLLVIIVHFQVTEDW